MSARKVLAVDDCVGRFFEGDARDMRELPDNSIPLIITSPPYNVGKAYATHDDAQTQSGYFAFLYALWDECYRVLGKGGRLCVVVANTDRKPYLPLNAIIATQCIELGYLMRGEIIWDKGASVGVSTAWGSFARASNPTLRDVCEYVLVFSKEQYPLACTRGTQSGISNADFVELTRNVWHIRTERASAEVGGVKVKHPAPFPRALVRALCLMYSNVGDIVLDPCMGSGTTAIGALEVRRNFVGYDVSAQYIAMALARLTRRKELKCVDDSRFTLCETALTKRVRAK